eukprot:218931-Rhodomonas_salina.1
MPSWSFVGLHTSRRSTIPYHHTRSSVPAPVALYHTTISTYQYHRTRVSGPVPGFLAIPPAPRHSCPASCAPFGIPGTNIPTRQYRYTHAPVPRCPRVSRAIATCQ